MKTIENAQIKSAELSMEDHGCLVYRLNVEGEGWGTDLGGYCIGSGYLGAKEFTGSQKGTEAIMRIMDTVGVERWSDLEGKYIRVEINSMSDPVFKFGHIIKNKWFDQKEFFSGK